MEEKKKKRGRPTLSPEEKARRKIEREANKKNQKRQKKKKEKISTLVAETKFKITEKPNKLIVSPEIKTAIEPILIENEPTLLQENKIITFEDYSALWQTQTIQLTDKIKDLEGEIIQIQNRLNRLNDIAIDLQTERKLIKELIRMDQDIIYKNEEKIPFIDTQEFKYQADRPDWIRHIVEFLTGIPDEMLTNNRIRKQEFKLFNRKEQLIELDSELGDITITLFYNDDLFKALKSSVTNFRSIRIEMGSDFRQSREISKKKKLTLNQNQIITSLQENIKKINSVGENFYNIMLNTQKNVSQIYSEFNQKEQKLLNITSPAQKEYSTYEFDNMISSIFKDFKSDKKK